MDNLIPSIINPNQKMTSLEVARLVRRHHKNVLRDIKQLIEQQIINGPSSEPVDYKDAKGEMRPLYRLDFEATMTLITGYRASVRHRVIKRWLDLEARQATSPAFSTKTSPTSPLDLITAELLKARPLWGKIKRYTDMGLSRKEIVLLVQRHRDTIRKHIRRMEKLSILTPPANLAKLQAEARHLRLTN